MTTNRQDTAHLARELGELARRAPARLSERLATLDPQARVDLALRLPAAERMQLMLHDPRPMRLVRSLPASELYLTVREIGPLDALPLLALASAEQLEHLLDLEAWRGDRFDAKRCGAWVALLFEAGEPTARRILRHLDDEMLGLLFQSWVRVRPVEFEDDIELHSTNRPEAGDERGLRSPDGAYHFSPVIEEHAPTVQRLARMLFVEDPDRYRRILWSASWELPAELEESTYRWRTSRLEEFGFPRIEEALETYAPPSEDVVPRAAPSVRGPAPRTAIRILDPGDIVARAVEETDPERRERLLAELTSLANRLLVADQADTGDPAVHREALATAAGYVRIALERRAEPALPTLARVPVIELFREGYALAAHLAGEASQLLREGWPAAATDGIEWLDSPLREQVQALVLTRPCFLEISSGGTPRARPFRSVGELEESSLALDLARALGTLFVEQLGMDLERAVVEARRPPLHRADVWFRTLLARHQATGEISLAPLAPEQAARSVTRLREEGGEAPERLVADLPLDPRARALLAAYGRSSIEQLAVDSREAFRVATS